MTAETRLKEGDRIGVGGAEMIFHAQMAVDPLGATVVAQKLNLPSDATVVAGKLPTPPPPSSKAGAGGGAASGPPVDRASALTALDLAQGADDAQILRKYQELYSDYQIRLTNAPTPELKKSFQRKLEELQAAFEILSPAGTADADAGDLPAAEPVADVPSVAAPPDPPSSGAVVQAAAEKAAAPQAAPLTKAQKKAQKKAKRTAAKKADKASGEGVPKSTWIMAGFATLGCLATAFLGMKALAATRVQGALETELADRRQAIVEMQEKIPQVTEELEQLRMGKASLLENKDFKVCNHSSREIQVGWVHTAWIGPNAEWRTFDSAFFGYPRWPIGAGGTGKFDYVSGDQVIWDGSAIFFSILIDYGRGEYFRSGAIEALDGDCFNLDLDR